MFEPFLIVVFESLVPSVNRWISKSYKHFWKGFKYAKYAGKLKNFRDQENFSEEHWAVYQDHVVDHPDNYTQYLESRVH